MSDPASETYQSRVIDPALISEGLVRLALDEIDKADFAGEIFDAVLNHAPGLSELDQARLRRFIESTLTAYLDETLSPSTAYQHLLTCLFRAWRGPDALRAYIGSVG